MSTFEEITQVIEHLYTMNRIILTIQKKPNEYAGEVLFSNESHTLKAIAEHEGISQAELSDLMYRTKGATSAVVDKLAEKGLVTRERVGGDQRRYLLTLTQRGWAVHRAHMDYDGRHAHKVWQEAGLSKEDLEAANRTLERMIRFYSTGYLDHGVLRPDI